MKENHITNHIAIIITRHKLLGLIDSETLKVVDAQTREYFERIRAFKIHIRHVVRLVIKHTGFLPGALFISPVCELGRNHWIDIGSSLRITQQLNWTPYRLY